MAPNKQIKANRVQQEIFLTFMEAHPEFAAGKFTGSAGRERNNQMWETLARQLNAQGVGPTKDVTRWKIAWNSWRGKVRNKAAAVQAFLQGTGGGNSSPIPLTPLEERLMDLMGRDVIRGMGGIKDFGLPPTEEQSTAAAPRVEIVDYTVDQLTCELIVTQSDLEDDPLTPTPNFKESEATMQDDFQNQPAISSFTFRASTPIPSTSGPSTSGLKRKQSTAESSGSKHSRTEENAFSRAVDKFVSLEDKKLELAKQTHNVLAEGLRRFLDLYERQTVAAEKTAEAVVAESRERRARMKKSD